MKMTPREALYYVCLALGPQPKTNRDDNLTYDEARLRDAIRVLQNFVTYHNDADKAIPTSANEYTHYDEVLVSPSQVDSEVHVQPRKPVREGRGSGKERLDTWKKEAKDVYKGTVSGKTRY